MTSFDFDPASPAVREAKAGLVDDEIRTARRLLNSGETASDPRIARLVVALAEQERRGDARLIMGWLLVGALGLWAIVELITDPLGPTALAALVAAAVSGVMITARTRRVLRQVRAERENRAYAEQFGAPSAAVEEPVLVAPSVGAVGIRGALSRAVTLFVIAAAGTAVAEITLGHHEGSIGAVSARPLLLGGAFALLELGRAWYRAQYGR